MEAFNKIKTEYLEFRQKLDNDINSSPNLNTSEDCFLIEESYIKKIGNNNIKPNLSNSFKNLKEALKIPKIINDFEDAIKHIYFNIQLKLISIKIFELMGFKNILKDTNIVNYFAGNKKLIIEFKKEGGNKALLLNNYSDDIQSKNNIFIINKSKDIYKNILNNINYLNDKEIISFYNYIGKDSIINNQKKMNIISKKINTSNNNMKNTNFSNNQETLIISNRSGVDNENLKEIKENENEENFKKDLIKIFINVFYYEQLFSNKKTNIFNNKEIYYIINPDWLANYKKYYNYEQLENLLKKENKNINYFNLNKYYDNIAQNCLKNDNILNFEKKDLSQELRTNISYIIKKDYDIYHFFKGLIMPSKIMNIIKSIHNINNKSILPNSIIFNNNNIFFIKINNIIVGNDNDIPRILSKYVFNYKDNNTLNTEKNEILLHNINEYIQLRKCNENSEDLQILKNEKNEEIGKFFVVNYIHKKNSQTKKLVSNERNQNGFSNKSHPKYKNNKISLIPHKQNYQKRNNNFINLTMPATLDNKNFQNLVNNQNINNKDSKNSENNNFSEAKTLKEENYKLKNENENLKNINLQMKQELDIAKNLINIYQKKEDHKNTNKFMNENIKNENKEILIDKENNEFEKNENINQENNIEINNQIEKTEKQLNNLNNQILPNQNEQSQNNQYMNYNGSI